MKNVRIFTAVFFAPLVLLATGCATVVRGTTDTVQFDTDPAGAEVRLSNGQACVTPCNMEIKRNVRHLDVAIKLDGYHPADTMLTSEISGGGVAGVAGNAILGGVVGMVIDSASGAMLDIHPNPLIVKMVPDTEPKPARANVVLPDPPAQLSYEESVKQSCVAFFGNQSRKRQRCEESPEEYLPSRYTKALPDKDA